MWRPTVPQLQLVQTLQQSAGAVSHGHGAAELGRVAHFRLYFRLSHDEKWTSAAVVVVVAVLVVNAAAW